MESIHAYQSLLLAKDENPATWDSFPTQIRTFDDREMRMTLASEDCFREVNGIYGINPRGHQPSMVGVRIYRF